MAWEVRYSNSKHLPYFYNPDTSESRWEAPTGMTDDQVRNLPGAAQYLGGAGGARAPKASASNGAGDEKVRASHILAKHAGSRRPSSWRQPNVTRSIDEARQIIQNHIDELSKLSGPEQQARFAQIASSESDCSSAKKGGDLGQFGRQTMQPAFEEASFALQPGQLSGLVETDSGVHVILRTQ